MSPAARALVLGGRVVLDRCPEHPTVATVERCPRCMGRLLAQLDRLGALDAAGAVPPIPHGATA